MAEEQWQNVDARKASDQFNGLIPYYDHAGISIYHGDAREVSAKLSRNNDLVLTDPPYGIGLNTDYRKRGKAILGRSYEPLSGDLSPQNYQWLFSISKISIVFGANNFPQQIPFDSHKDGWICWDKRTNEASDRLFGSPFELAVVKGWRCYEIIRLQHCGVKNADGDRAGRFHPTQKPIKLMSRILTLCDRKAKLSHVMDPFMGSGTTLIAAKKHGLCATGIEIEERYCEIAAKRLAQEVLF